ncbi:hypothetical protein ACN26Y_21455 [Micromonospora sp. WMMD558]|uniref:8-oxoguanine DNA glycosylase OGG fold protein n=1 Tax=Micromonospora sp. WMMD558 TaxID=3403462 RepID=UPI003BF4EA63
MSSPASSHPLPFRGLPPDRLRWVERQTTEFDPQLWQDALSADSRWWPRELEEAGSTIDRTLVHVIGRRATEPVAAAHTFVAATVWGSGNRRIRLRTRSWADAFEVVANRLAAAARLLQDEGPFPAYAALLPGGRLYVNGVGPSFFTKFLYFAGYLSAVDQLRPLIFDRVVRDALRMLCGLDLRGNSVADYETYLELARNWAQEWQTEPDVVERVLFDVGKCPRLAVHVLLGREV